MTEEQGFAPGVPDVGNLWNGDHNSEGFRFLAKTAADFARMMSGRRLWLHGNALAGETADWEEDIGKRLEFVGIALQEHAALRKASMDQFGATILQRLAQLPLGKRMDLATVVSDDTDDVVTAMAEVALQDLVRGELVDVIRPRPGKIGDPPRVDTYAITPKGLMVLGKPQLATTATDRAAIGGGDETAR